MSDSAGQKPNPSAWFDQMPQGPAMQRLPNSPQDLHDGHEQSTTHFNQLNKVYKRLDAIRTGLGRLTKLGDTVTAEDVVDEAAKLLHKGFSSQEVASQLADMPADGGQALAGWINQQVATSRANEAKLRPALDAARHQMGVSALHSILGHQLGGEAPGPATPSNPLTNPQGA